MNGSRRLAGLALVAAVCLMVGNVTIAKPQAAAAPAGGAQAGQDAAKPQYTMAEYNAYTAAQATKDPTAQLKALDDFVAKYPNSALLIYVYPLYFNAYSQLKNWQKVIEYADKTLALGDKIEPPVKYQAYYARAFAYTNIQPPPTDPDQAKKARQAALDGLQTLNSLKKPDAMSQDDFDKQKKAPAILFNYTAASAATALKDNPGAIESYKAVLA